MPKGKISEETQTMTPESSDDVVRHGREVRAKQIEDCSRRAAQKIVAKFRTGKISTDSLAKLTAEEFEELNR
jgi:hypothetical protein